ncbi:hypothetical protein Q4E93_21110 [Flavitalea sp. BT771]|uniref:hypothetical protein n=1 Tax=Flavitalea sp. BT771 TaxID=3063329 RepID=UPI0026E2710A|nr:hypothetical protein [Flavitalea sp. BT771]MDO6433122.1 hypothetical protein [Flavitalea sp. BT771]MDV6221602.1 hypothetical protein [Flavitalea sp. BT771]
MRAINPGKGRLILVIAAAVFLLPVLVPAWHLLQKTGGAFSLPRDESFLQLSTAKALAFRHIWGVGLFNFESASPSLLYPLLLAAVFFIFGAHLVIIPILNAVIGIILLSAIQKWLSKRGTRPVNQLFVLLAVIVLTPLPLMVISGMESPLLLLFAFLFVSRLSDEWTMPAFSRRTLIYGALLVASRYDGALLVAGASLLLIFRRKWLEAFELVLWSLLPILAFGIVSVFKGSYFLPNPFMVGPAGSMLSYDWLLGCGLAVALPLLSRWHIKRLDRKTTWVAGLTALCFSLLIMTRNLYAFRETSRSSVRIYRQEYPAGQFVRRYYYHQSIVSDDMSVLSYLAEGQYVDLSGLASVKVARSKVHHFFSPRLVHQLSDEQNTQVAIITDRYDHGLPERWVRTASWEIPAYDQSGKKTFNFYGMDSGVAITLKRNLENYAPYLSRDITVQYYYFPPR